MFIWLFDSELSVLEERYYNQKRVRGWTEKHLESFSVDITQYPFVEF